MSLKKNKVKVDLCSYPPYMLLAERKFGKTTFWYNLVREAWGDDDKGYLISFGNEEGYHSLDGIAAETVKEWNMEYDEELDERGFVQVVDDIIENNDEYGLKGVCFDTLDTMVDVCTKEVLRLHMIEKHTPCKSLNDAFGGFTRGTKRLLDLIKEQESRLRDAGLTVFYLCHTKLKDKTDLKTGEKYEQITNNLQANIYTEIADHAQMVMVGLIERDIVNSKITDERRVVYLRGNSEVDAGSRFTVLPEKISLDPKEFLAAFEQGVKGSMRNPENYEKDKKAEEKQIKNKAIIARKRENEPKEDELEENRENYIEILSSKIPSASAKIKSQLKNLIASGGYSSIKDTEIPIIELKKLVDMFEE